MRVLLATDGSADANASVDMLLGFGPDSGIMTTVLAVAPGHPLLGADLAAPPGTESDDPIDIARAIVDAACERLRQAGNEAAPMVRQGHPVDEILAEIQDIDAEIAVLGLRGVGKLRRMFAGSVAKAVARLAPSPVLLVNDPGSLARTLIATDGSPGSERALEAFRRLPPAVISRVILLHVESGSATTVPPDVDLAVAELRHAGVDVSQQTAHGNEVEEIVRVARETGATLIVIGASRNQVDGEPVLGTTANGVINQAPCSILIGR